MSSETSNADNEEQSDNPSRRFREEGADLNKAEEYDRKREKFLSSQNAKKNDTPSQEELKNLQQEEADLNKAKGKFDLKQEQARAQAIKNAGFEGFYNLRKEWSNTIQGWISALIIFDISITIFVGSGILKYHHYKWFIISVTLETFLQIVGMGYIAVRFLFSSQQKDDTP